MERTVFTGGAVFDASGTDPVPGEVVVDGDRVVEVRSGWREDHGTARVVNIAGRTIMPGLIESHAHLTFPSAVGHIDPSFNPPLDVSFFHRIEGIEAELARAERNAAILLDAGFTSAYSAGSLLPMPVEVILRDKIKAGAVRGPRLRAASAERDNHPLRPDGHFVADWQGPDACLADLLVVPGNPAEDVTLPQDAANLEWIVQGGRGPQAARVQPAVLGRGPARHPCPSGRAPC
jgi:cytosine/adenosine deaminase-related metal-dependent hydrolase